MALPGNGIFVVKGEMSILMTAMRRGARWSSHSYQDDDVEILKNFQELKETLNNIDDLRLIEPDVFLSPFLEVIRSEETTGPVTSLALSAVNKFLSYGLIDPTHNSVHQCIANIADAVTHARFVGTDQSSDGVVLIRILQVLRTLTLAPEGATLTNESLCEIMLSCFRICFEPRLNELLRKTAEHYLKDMVQLVFMRLPQFSEDIKAIGMRQLKMRPNAIDQTRTKRKTRQSFSKKKEKSEKNEMEDTPSPVVAKPQNTLRANPLSTTPMTPGDNIVDMQGSISQSTPQVATDASIASPSSFETPQEGQECYVEINVQSPSSTEEGVDCSKEGEEDATLKELLNERDSSSPKPADVEEQTKLDTYSTTSTVTLESSPVTNFETSPDGQCYSGESISQDYINQRGIRFTPQIQDEIVQVPYGLACVRELLRFLISLCNPLDKQNTDVMIHVGLTLLTVSFEVGADSIGKFNTLLALVKDDLCRNLFSLLNTERLSVFAADLQLSFLMFESLRAHLKFQMNCYLTKLEEIIVSENAKITYEQREIALDNILQLWRIPGFVNELYLNYDCDMYCTNLYEDLTKLLAKNTMSATTGIYHTHLLSLDALLTVIEGIEARCTSGKNDSTICNSEKLDSSNGSITSINNFIGKSSRVKLSQNIPTKEELLVRKNIKKWLPTGTEYFNQKPKKGIQFLQEHGVLKSELDPHEIALFLRENPGLDKKMIGEYISSRSNLNILAAFVKTFEFSGIRIDEALRSFLESFRLPGEAPTISLILEHFAEHWHKSNNEPFADVDSAFTLAYAVIMLNVDQHNQNAKKQNTPMSASGFKKNLKGVNGGNDFDEELIEEIYTTIRNNEIVMPSEKSGIVKENYLWKVLLNKGASKDGIYHYINDSCYDSELYQLVYGPVVAALSFLYEKSEEPAIYKKVIHGFECCAFICSHFGMFKNLDMLVVTLCKFTIFYNQRRQNNIAIQFGASPKAQLALKSLFLLIHLHGDCIREGWKTIFDLILSLYSNGLLPKCYIEADDFIEPSGRIVLEYKEVENLQKQDTGLLSSLYSYMVSTENLAKVPTPEEQQYIDCTKESIKDCNLEQLITDSKFLHEAALLELTKSLIELSRGPDSQKNLDYNSYNENVTVFFMELLFKIVIQNRDRVKTIWYIVRDHIYTLVMNASLFDYQFLLERSVIGLLRVAIRLMRNEDMCPIVIQSLRMLLLLKSSTIWRISRQISFGLYELLKTSAQNIHTNADWTIIFTLLECVGAAAQPPKPIVEDSTQIDQGAKSDGENQANSDEDSYTDRGYTSDSELTKSPKHSQPRSQSPVIIQNSPVGTPNTGGWILVGNEGEIQPVVGRTVPPTQYGIALERSLGPHDPSSLIKCCESLAFLVRDVAHITPYNFDVCVHCIRTFVEASLRENRRAKRGSDHESRPRRKTVNRKRSEMHRSRRSPASSLDEEDESDDDDDLPSGYHHLLLDLMHTLHTRTAQIFKWWAEEGGEIAQETSLWTQGWCPLLQGIARMCCDKREQVRMSAIAFLQRALLVHDLQTLTGPEWEQCFHRVLFPLLNYLLQPVDYRPISMAEFRNRAATVLSKVFLHHLTPLLTLPTFSNLWIIILDFMDRYMHADKSDILYEAIPELLKNMLLVMNSARVFDGPDGKTPLWALTWDRIGKFLPNLKDDLFKEINEGVEELEQSSVQAGEQQAKKGASPLQHNIENATRSSIIFQPPSSQISSHLFAHLGQMVSTPIGSAHAVDHLPSRIKSPTTTPAGMPLPPLPQATPVPLPPLPQVTPMPQVSPGVSVVPNQTSPIMQPTLQTGMPYMSNLLTAAPNANQHMFPVLYNSPVVPSTTTSEVQPVSLYAEYMGNPYNVLNPNVLRQESATSPGSAEEGQNTDNGSGGVSDSNKNEVSSNNNEKKDNVLSNYFSGNSGDSFIPTGSEILFGVDKNADNIPMSTSTSESKQTNV